MIDLTPLDVRKKKGDIGRTFRGYDPEEVDTFLEIVADRLEELVKENMTLKERSERLADQVDSLQGRENAVHEALVTAQELSSEIGDQARREARILRRETEAEIRRVEEAVEDRIQRTLREADRLLDERKEALRELDRMRTRFLKSLRGLLEKELDAVTVEEAQEALRPEELELDVSDWRERLRRVRAEVEFTTTPEEPVEEASSAEALEDAELAAEEALAEQALAHEPPVEEPVVEEPPVEGPPHEDDAPPPEEPRVEEAPAAEAPEPPVEGTPREELDAVPVEDLAPEPGEPEPTAATGEPGPGTGFSQEEPPPEEDEGPQPWDPEYEIPPPPAGGSEGSGREFYGDRVSDDREVPPTPRREAGAEGDRPARGEGRSGEEGGEGNQSLWLSGFQVESEEKEEEDEGR